MSRLHSFTYNDFAHPMRLDDTPLHTGCRNAADEVLALLEMRKGFDEWWEEIGEENRTEIVHALEDAIFKEVEVFVP